MVSVLQKPQEDLFADSTMTFGEHLEELRQALFKAVIGLVVGTCLGFLVGKYVIATINHPLEAALGKYYMDRSIKLYGELVEQFAASGQQPPYTLQEVEYLVRKKQMTFEVRFVHAGLVRRELSESGGTRVPPRAEGFEGLARTAADAGLGAADQVDWVARIERMSPVVHWQPVAEDERIKPQALGSTEGFTIWMKASLVVGLVISSPWVFYHIWAFVAAGLYPHERRYVYLFLPFSLGLFLVGAATAYLFVFQPVLDFLFGFNAWLGINPDPRINEWLTFVLLLPLGFGIAFQLPLVMFFLERIGIFDVRSYLEKWRMAVLVIFILSAVLTPADPYSIFLMAVPLTVLYFGGIGLCYFWPRKTSPLA